MANTGKRPWRKNVLLLVISGYATVLVIFLLLAFSTLTAAEAYDAVQGPLMALVGGSLAIAKDLIQLDQREDSTAAAAAQRAQDHSDTGGNGDDGQGDPEG